MALDTSTERVRQICEGIRVTPANLRWGGDNDVRTFLALADERDRLADELKRLREDRAFITGWNDGFETAIDRAAEEAMVENQRRLDLASIRVPAMACEIRDAILALKGVG